MIQDVLKYMDSIGPTLLFIIILFRRHSGWKRDYIFWFILAQVIFNNTASFLEIKRMSNLYIYHINCVISFAILSAYFNKILLWKRITPIIIIVYILFFAFFIYDTIKLESFNSFNSYTYGIAGLVLITYSFLYFLEQILWPTTRTIIKSKNFWYVTAIFTYYASNFFIFISYKWLTEEYTINVFSLIWRIHNVILALICVYLYIGFRQKLTS